MASQLKTLATPGPQQTQERRGSASCIIPVCPTYSWETLGYTDEPTNEPEYRSCFQVILLALSLSFWLLKWGNAISVNLSYLLILRFVFFLRNSILFFNPIGKFYFLFWFVFNATPSVDTGSRRWCSHIVLVGVSTCVQTPSSTVWQYMSKSLQHVHIIWLRSFTSRNLSSEFLLTRAVNKSLPIRYLSQHPFWFLKMEKDWTSKKKSILVELIVVYPKNKPLCVINMNDDD